MASNVAPDSTTPSPGSQGDPAARKFVDWVATKDADLTATTTKKQC